MQEKSPKPESTSSNPLEFRASIINYGTSEDSNSPVLAASGDNINIIFSIPKRSFHKMALAVINHLEQDSDFKTAEDSTPEKDNKLSNLNKITEDEVMDYSEVSRVSENSTEDGDVPRLNIESCEDVPSVLNKISLNTSHCNGSTKSKPGFNSSKIEKPNDNESDIHLKEPSNDFRCTLETWRRISISNSPNKESSKNLDLIASSPRNKRCNESSVTNETDLQYEIKSTLESESECTKDERKHVGEMEINESSMNCKEYASGSENLSKNIINEKNISSHSLHTSNESCPELNGTWPELHPFTESEEIPVKELKSLESESNGVLIKYFKLEFSNELVLIKITNSNVRAMKYKESKDPVIQLECSEEMNSLNESNSSLETSNYLIRESSAESPAVEKHGTSPKSSLDKCNQLKESINGELEKNEQVKVLRDTSEYTVSEFTDANKTFNHEYLQHQNLETDLKEPDLSPSSEILNSSSNHTIETLGESKNFSKLSLEMNISVINSPEDNLKESTDEKSQTKSSENSPSGLVMEPIEDELNLSVSITSSERFHSTVNNSLNISCKIEETSYNEVPEGDPESVIEPDEKLKYSKNLNENFQSSECFKVISSDKIGFIAKISEGNCGSNNEETCRETAISNDVVEPVLKDHNSGNENSFNVADASFEATDIEQKESNTFSNQNVTISPSETSRSLSDTYFLNKSKDEYNQLNESAEDSDQEISRILPDTSNSILNEIQQNESYEKSISNLISTNASDVLKELPEKLQTEKDCSSEETLSTNSNLALSNTSDFIEEKISNARNDTKDMLNELPEKLETKNDCSPKETLATNFNLALPNTSDLAFIEEKISEENDTKDMSSQLLEKLEVENNCSPKETLAEKSNLTLSESTNEIHFREEKLSNYSLKYDSESDSESKMHETNLNFDMISDEEKLDNVEDKVTDKSDISIKTCNVKPAHSPTEKELKVKVESTVDIKSTKIEIEVEADIQDESVIDVTVGESLETSVQHEPLNVEDFSEKCFKGKSSECVLKENLNIQNDTEVKSTENSFASSGDSVMDMADANSENMSERSDAESDEVKSASGSEDGEKQAKLHRGAVDEVDCAPSRNRRRKLFSGLSKDVIPEHTEVTNVRSSKLRADTSKFSGRKSPVARSLRSKSLEPSNESPHKHVESAEASRKTRAKTPDVISKKDLKTTVRSSPRKFTRSSTVESSSSSKVQNAKSTVTDNQSKSKTNLDSSSSSKRITKKRGTRD